MNYEERYGERILSDWEEELERKKIEDKERLEDLEKCIEKIKETLETKAATKEELQELVSEIEYEIKCLG